MSNSARYMTLEVVGDALAPQILEGDVLNVDTHAIPRANGKDLSVLSIAGHLHVCRFVNYGNQVLLFHDNAPISVVNKANVEVIGKVTQVLFEPINEENLSAENTEAFIAQV